MYLHPLSLPDALPISMGPLRLLHSFHKQKRRQSAPFLQRSNAMSVCVGPRLLLIAVARVVAVASHHFIARGAEGVALVPVRPLVAVDQDAADRKSTRLNSSH